jgi:hypothetical protein
MIVLSLNSKGVGGALKQQALKRMRAVYKPDILSLQETMCAGPKVVDFLSYFLKEWSFGSLDADGLSGGLFSGWNPIFVAISSSVLNAGIEIEIRSKELGKVYIIINLYGPYGDKKPFWEGLGDSGIFTGENLIVGGDLNLTLNQREICGGATRNDPPTELFCHLFESQGLIDVDPVKVVPT